MTLEHQCPQADTIMNYMVIQSSDLQPIASAYFLLHFLSKPHVSASWAQGYLTMMSQSLKALAIAHSDSPADLIPSNWLLVSLILEVSSDPHTPTASHPVYHPGTLK